MGRDKRNEKRERERFTSWIASEKCLPSWKALSFSSREAYHHLRIRCFAETKKLNNNNGEIFRSPRKLAEDMGCSAKVAMKSLADLEAKGWIVCTKLHELGCHGQGKTALFRLTMLPTGDAKKPVQATREPVRWTEGSDYEVIAYPKHKPKGYIGQSRNFKNKSPHPNWTQPCIQIECGNDDNEPNPASKLNAETAQNPPNPAPKLNAYILSHAPTADNNTPILSNYLEFVRAGNWLCLNLEKQPVA